MARSEEWREREREKSFTVEKEEERTVVSGDNLPWSEDEQGCPRSRDLLWLVGERRAKHEQPVAVQCRVICLYSAVSGCATCWKPPYSALRITLSRKFVRNIMPQLGSDIAVRIYHSGKNEGFPLLSLSCSFSLALSSSVHYAARRPFVTHELEWNDLGHWHKILSRFENSWWVNRVVNMPNWHVRCCAPFGNNHSRTLCLAERFTSDRDGNCPRSMFY